MKYYIPSAYTLALIGVYFLSLPLSLLLQHESIQSSKNASLFDFSGPFPFTFLLVVSTVFVIPLVEEFFTRGLMLSALAPYGKGFAIIITSIFFAILHGNFDQIFTPLILGMIYAYVTLETGTIKNSFILHSINNAITTLTGIINIYIPPVGNILFIVVYAVLGSIGIWILIKNRSKIIENLHTERENFIPVNRVRKFICNPLMLLTIIFSIVILFTSIRSI